MKIIDQIRLFQFLILMLSFNSTPASSSSADPTNLITIHKKAIHNEYEHLNYQNTISLMKTNFKAFLSLFHDTKIIDFSSYSPELKAGFYLLQGESYKDFLHRSIHEQMQEADNDKEQNSAEICFDNELRDIKQFSRMFFHQEQYFYPEAHQAALIKIVDDLKESYCHSIDFAIEHYLNILKIQDPVCIFFLNMSLLNTIFNQRLSLCLNDYKDANGDGLLEKAVKKINMNNMRFLVKAKMNVNKQNNYKQTPLHWAVKTNNKQAIKLLIQVKANLNLQDNLQYTPLHIAIIVENQDIVELLIPALINGKSDLNINIQNTHGKTPLFIAFEKNNRHTIKLLIKAGANTDGLNYKNRLIVHSMKFIANLSTSCSCVS